MMVALKRGATRSSCLADHLALTRRLAQTIAAAINVYKERVVGTFKLPHLSFLLPTTI